MKRSSNPGRLERQRSHGQARPSGFPEGRFFPDTYRFVRGMTDVELLKKAYDRLDEVLAKEWESARPMRRTPSPIRR
jgi:cell division protein YceG involved in septum cleavage